MKVMVPLVALFIMFPILEFAVLIEIGQRIGTVYTLILVFGTGVAGAILAKMEGLRIIGRIQDELRAGNMPADQLLDGLIVLVAGVLLVTPGFLSDMTGLLLLFAPTRYPFKLFLRRIVRQWIYTKTLRISI
jgi:UPF0716 protein FxsA